VIWRGMQDQSGPTTREKSFNIVYFCKKKGVIPFVTTKTLFPSITEGPGREGLTRKYPKKFGLGRGCFSDKEEGEDLFIWRKNR